MLTAHFVACFVLFSSLSIILISAAVGVFFPFYLYSFSRIPFSLLTAIFQRRVVEIKISAIGVFSMSPVISLQGRYLSCVCRSQ